MLRQLTLDEVKKYIVDDTVRPHLSAEFRISHSRQVWGLFEDQYTTEDTPSPEPRAVICVAYCTSIPETEFELAAMSAPVGGEPELVPPAFDPAAFNENAHRSLESALEDALEIQGKLQVWPSGTITNRFGETMIYDTSGNLAPCPRVGVVEDEPNVAVFYTVWSYDPGAGTQIVNQLSEHIRETNTDIWEWVTLSPCTKMAERFHTRNGAKLLARYDVNQTFTYTDQVYPIEQRLEDIRLANELEEREAEQREAPALE